jgi:hypothetical protein
MNEALITCATRDTRQSVANFLFQEHKWDFYGITSQQSLNVIYF